MSTRAAVYARISQDKTGAGLGVERQRADCEALAKANSWNIVEIYEDNDISAYSGKRRPGYRAMLDAARNRDFDVILAWHTDRLHRSNKELEEFIDIIEPAGINVVTVKGGVIDLATPTGRMVARSLGTIATFQSEHRSEQLTRKHQQLREQGRPSGGGSRAWGYEASGMQIRESEAAVIRDVATRLIAGESIGSVVRWLNSEGHTTTSGGPWRSTTFKRSITSARLCAWRELDGQLVTEGIWPAILTRTETEQLRSALTNPARAHSGPPRKYLLSGMLRCDHCGHPMLGAPRDDGSRRYRCVPLPAGKGCGKMFVLAEPAEAEIEAQFFALLAENDFTGLVRQTTDAPELMQAVQADEARLVELGQDRDDGNVTRAEYVARRARLTERLEANRAALVAGTSAVALTDLLRPGTDLESTWATLTLDRKRAALSAVIDHIVVTPAVRGRNRFDANRLAVRWLV